MRPRTLSEAAERIRRGTPAPVAFAEVLDVFYAADREGRLAVIRDEPGPTGDPRYDALMACAAEYLARQKRLGAVPAWTRDPGRILRDPWFTTVSEDPGLREYLAFTSPAEFRCRNVFTEMRPLRRASDRDARAAPD